MTPQASDDKTPDATLGRMSIETQLHGDLEGTSKGEMLTAGTAVKGSAGYVRSSASTERCTAAAAPSCSSTAAP